MTFRLGVVMDPISKINIKKDTSFALLLAAQEKGWSSFYIESHLIWMEAQTVFGRIKPIKVYDNPQHWFELGEEIIEPLTCLDVLLMRKDPPFDMRYIYLTYLLEQAEAQGLWVINKPQSLRDANEKLFASWFPKCCAETLVTSQIELLKKFALEYSLVVVKPLGAMAGHSIFRVAASDLNMPVILETVTNGGQQMVMMQRYIPDIVHGDKRILLINGNPIPYVLARIPSKNDFRGNLAAGAIGQGQSLTARDQWICDQVGPVLQKKGLFFVGIDVIGNYLTEINVTSPTGVRELNQIFKLNIGAQMIEMIEKGSP